MRAPPRWATNPRTGGRPARGTACTNPRTGQAAVIFLHCRHLRVLPGLQRSRVRGRARPWYLCWGHHWVGLSSSYHPLLCPRPLTPFAGGSFKGRTVDYISLFSHSATGDTHTVTHSVFHYSCRPLLSRSSTDHYTLPLVTELSLAGLLHVNNQLVLEVIFSGFSFAITSTLSWVAGHVVGEHSKTFELPPRRRYRT